ncbi:MAG: hypothetical protein HZA46_14555 [Planctomycetales bacterium]|nr:hypothetical protein [Planctomycetales bacterium]
MAAKLRDFLCALDALTERAPLDELLRWQRDLEVGFEELADWIRFSPTGYQRNLVREGPLYRMLVLCWATGQFSPIHDHAGSTCAVRVIRGTATETVYQQAENEVLQHTSHWIAGDVFGGSDGDIHAVGNFATDDTPLVTLHVYSPSLTRMSLYSLVDGQLVTQPTAIAATTATQVVTPTTSVARRHSVVATV